MSIFNNYYRLNKELKQEVEFYSRENFLKEERYRKLNKEYKELLKENEQLKDQLEKMKGERDGSKTARTEHNTRNEGTGRTRSK